LLALVDVERRGAGELAVRHHRVETDGEASLEELLDESDDLVDVDVVARALRLTRARGERRVGRSSGLAVLQPDRRQSIAHEATAAGQLRVDRIDGNVGIGRRARVKPNGNVIVQNEDAEIESRFGIGQKCRIEIRAARPSFHRARVEAALSLCATRELEERRCDGGHRVPGDDCGRDDSQRSQLHWFASGTSVSFSMRTAAQISASVPTACPGPSAWNHA
jgi:hypothetical protein